MQHSIRGTVIRGGTSRGVFLRLADLPPDPAKRDSLLLQLLGSPDPIQVDGLGGGHSHTSKAMAVGPSDQPGVDVDYLFAQVDVRQPMVDYGGNCGNLTAAVAVYAVGPTLTGRVQAVVTWDQPSPILSTMHSRHPPYSGRVSR